MRSTLSIAVVIAAFALTGCTKDDLFPDPLGGTVRELGFEWLDTVESCLDSDDHSTAYCGTAKWLDGSRVEINLPDPESVGFDTDEPLFREIMKSGSLRYVYNPTSQTVTLFLVSGNVTLEWNEGLKCLEGDLLDQDYLSICTRGATPTPGS